MATKEEILRDLKEGKIEVEEATRMLNELDQQQQQRRGTLYCKVSEKGAVSVYGLQRMPVTLYVEQWTRLLDFGDEIRKFLSENDAKLKRKEK